MKKVLLVMSCLLLSVLFVGCGKKTEEQPEVTPTPTPSPTPEPVTYKDGTYEVESEPDSEGYFTKAELTIEGGKITDVDWTIYDSRRDDRPFDETYEEVFEGQDLYMQQSRDDWNGSRDYAKVLIETQNPDDVDAVSGATWTNGKFKRIVEMALKEAEN